MEKSSHYTIWKRHLKSRSTVGVCDEIKDQKILRLFINNSVMIESVLEVVEVENVS